MKWTITLRLLWSGNIFQDSRLSSFVPAKPETVYELASATKPFVATAIMLLLQEGKLSLEDRVCQYVEGTPEAWRSITLRQLLSHTSGIKDYLERSEMTPYDLPPEK